MTKRIISLLAVLAIILPDYGLTHGGVTRASLLKDTDIRLFIADNMDSTVVTVDFPSGEIINRVTVPPSIMILAESNTKKYIYAMRGRDTDQDSVSILSTGFDSKTNSFRPPHLIRTIPFDTPGGPRKNKMATVNGYDTVITEGDGKIVVLQTDVIDGLSEIPTRTYDLAAPDHYHYMEGEKNLYIGHLFKGFVQVLNRRTGREVKKIGNCPSLHGMTKDQKTGRIFYSCRTGLLVIGTRGKERAEEVYRIPYPDRGRSCAAFLPGRNNIKWCYTEGIIPQLYRLDLNNMDYRFEKLSVKPSIRQNVTEDGKYLLVLTKQGELSVYDGYSGDFIKDIEVSDPFYGQWNEDVGKAILPEITSYKGLTYISLTHEGRLAEIDIEAGKVNRYIDIGGFPTRMILLPKADLTT